MGRGRTFSREFKLAVVRQVVVAEQRPAQVCREHGSAEGRRLRWRRESAAHGEAAFAPPEATSTAALEGTVAELERCCGQLAVEHAALQKGLSALPSRSDTR